MTNHLGTLHMYIVPNTDLDTKKWRPISEYTQLCLIPKPSQTTSYQGMLTTCWFVLELVSMLVECNTAFNTNSQIDSA